MGSRTYRLLKGSFHHEGQVTQGPGLLYWHPVCLWRPVRHLEFDQIRLRHNLLRWQQAHCRRSSRYSHRYRTAAALPPPPDIRLRSPQRLPLDSRPVGNSHCAAYVCKLPRASERVDRFGFRKGCSTQLSHYVPSRFLYLIAASFAYGFLRQWA